MCAQNREGCLQQLEAVLTGQPECYLTTTRNCSHPLLGPYDHKAILLRWDFNWTESQLTQEWIRSTSHHFCNEEVHKKSMPVQVNLQLIKVFIFVIEFIGPAQGGCHQHCYGQGLLVVSHISSSLQKKKPMEGPSQMQSNSHLPRAC